MDHEEAVEDKRSPLVMIGAIALLLLLVVWLVPMETVPLNPEPSGRLSLENALIGLDLSVGHDNSSIDNKAHYASRVDSTDPVVKVVADRVARARAGGSRDCHHRHGMGGTGAGQARAVVGDNDIGRGCVVERHRRAGQISSLQSTP